MVRPSPSFFAASVFAAAALLATLPAHAQGTEEQQDACAPDAFKFCQATIPDIPKTTACMQAHYSQLSKRCQVAFGEATGDGDKAPARAAGGAPALVPPAFAAAPAGSPDDSYAAQIRSYCKQGLIDPYTCSNTLSLLKGQ